MTPLCSVTPCQVDRMVEVDVDVWVEDKHAAEEVQMEFGEE